jgi:hypothetical protein
LLFRALLCALLHQEKLLTDCDCSILQNGALTCRFVNYIKRALLYQLSYAPIPLKRLIYESDLGRFGCR